MTFQGTQKLQLNFSRASGSSWVIDQNMENIIDAGLLLTWTPIPFIHWNVWVHEDSDQIYRFLKKRVSKYPFPLTLVYQK